MSALDFAHGQSFQEALHAITDAALEKQQRELDEKKDRYMTRLENELNRLRGIIDSDQQTLAQRNDRIYSDFGMLKLFEEETDLAMTGALDEKRFSGQAAKNNRFGAWKELEKLAKIDPELAARGGRFSGNRIQNLRDVLHMRIDEFCVYGAEHGLLNPDLKVVYSEEVRKKIYEFVDKQKMAAGKAPELNEVLLLQRVLNKNYDLAVDIQGKKPEGYAFKPINLIAAVGYTVKQLCQFSGLDEAPFVGHKYSDPAPVQYMDPANDQAANLLQVEYTALEHEADIKIRGSKFMAHEEAEKMIKNVNESFPDIKARVAAKISIVKFLELQAAIRPPEPKSPGAGQ